MSGEVIACGVITKKRADIPACVFNVTSQLKPERATSVGIDSMILESCSESVEYLGLERPYPFRFLHKPDTVRFRLKLFRLCRCCQK